MNQYLEEIGFDGQKDFNDYGTHTNVLGAKKVTEFFEEYLAPYNGKMPSENIIEAIENKINHAE